MACQFDNNPECTKKTKTCCLECVTKEENDCGIDYFLLCDQMDGIEFAVDCEYYFEVKSK